MSPPPDIPEWQKFMAKVLDHLNILLMIAGVLGFIAYGLDTTVPVNAILAGVLFFVVFFNSAIDYYQEKASSDIMAKFKTMLPPLCKVIREGRII